MKTIRMKMRGENPRNPPRIDCIYDGRAHRCPVACLLFTPPWYLTSVLVSETPARKQKNTFELVLVILPNFAQEHLSPSALTTGLVRFVSSRLGRCAESPISRRVFLTVPTNHCLDPHHYQPNLILPSELSSFVSLLSSQSGEEPLLRVPAPLSLILGLVE
jgi:hypothetical protein